MVDINTFGFLVVGCELTPYNVPNTYLPYYVVYVLILEQV